MTESEQALDLIGRAKALIQGFDWDYATQTWCFTAETWLEHYDAFIEQFGDIPNEQGSQNLPEVDPTTVVDGPDVARDDRSSGSSDPDGTPRLPFPDGDRESTTDS